MPSSPTSALCDIAETGGVWHFSEKTLWLHGVEFPPFILCFREFCGVNLVFALGSFALGWGLFRSGKVVPSWDPSVWGSWLQTQTMFRCCFILFSPFSWIRPHGHADDFSQSSTVFMEI